MAGRLYGISEASTYSRAPRRSLDEGEKVDWGHAETLAFATILADGKPIRITGQDAERATFAHRNLVLHDAVNGETFCPRTGCRKLRHRLRSITAR